MAFVNPNKPAGLNPLYYLRGADYDGKVCNYSILAADTNPYYPGDIVTLRSVVNGAASATNSDANGIPAIILATAGTASSVIGVIVAISGTPFGPYVNVANMGNIPYRPTGAQPINYYAAVSTDPDIVYEIQEGGAGTNLTQQNVGESFQWVYAAPATGVFVSGTQINNAVGSFATNEGLRLYRFVQRPFDNQFVTSPATGGGAQKWEVLLDTHVFASRPLPNA